MSSVTKEVVFNEDNSTRLLNGLNTLAKAVGSTLGPKGRNVILKGLGNTRITKDGVSVAREIVLDGVEGVGASLIKEVAIASDKQVGDGTTTATILANAIAQEGFKLIKSGIPAMELKRGVDKAVSDIVTFLENSKIEVNSLDDLYKVALISSNGDTEIASMIKKAFEKAGEDGIIIIDESHTNSTFVDNVEGVRFDQGIQSPYFVNDFEENTVSYKDANILVFEQNFDSIEDFQMMATGLGSKIAEPLIIIAPDFSQEIKLQLVGNRVKAHLPIAAIKAAGYGDRRTDFLHDLAVVTGATLVSKNLNEMKNFDVSWLGKCDAIKSNLDETTIIGGHANPQVLEEAKKRVEGLINTAKTDLDVKRYKERYGRLCSGLIVIKVGGITEIEVKERKDRFDDALGATIAAKEEGLLPGGGTALLHSALACRFNDLALELNKNEQLGYTMLLDCMEVPLHTLATNAGDKADYIVGKVMDSGSFSYGWDARNNAYGDMITLGIIDPLKVVRCSLENAASVATLIFTSSCTVLEKPQETKSK